MAPAGTGGRLQTAILHIEMKPPGSLQTFSPAYHSLSRMEWRRRVKEALGSLEHCRVCPRDCRVNRLQNKWSACKTGRYAVVSSAFPHFGEEDCLRGWNGSGTIFFSHCNLRCVFCQNYDISQAISAKQAQPGTPPEDIAAMMLRLQRDGCHNINFVTPEHVVPQVLEAVAIAVEHGKVNAERYQEINRRITSSELAEARAIAREAGLYRLDAR